MTDEIFIAKVRADRRCKIVTVPSKSEIKLGDYVKLQKLNLVEEEVSHV